MVRREGMVVSYVITIDVRKESMDAHISNRLLHTLIFSPCTYDFVAASDAMLDDHQLVYPCPSRVYKKYVLSSDQVGISLFLCYELSYPKNQVPS
jgi:hypothetical protein